MQYLLKPALCLAAMISGLAWLQAASAHSHEGPGEHVQSFETHLDAYAADVQRLSVLLDGIAGEYVAERDVQPAIDAFIEEWEVKQYHEAVETVSIPLYPPIWAAISKMQQAVKEKAPIKEFVQAVQGVKHSLHEGMGAVRLAAAQRVQGIEATQNQAAMNPQQGTHGKLDSQAEVKAIKDALDAAAAEYAEGHADDAKKLIGDAYLHRFEGLEGDLIAQDAELVSTLEKEFNVDLPVLINSGKPQKEVTAMVEQMKTRLDKAAELLAKADKKKSKVF
ncbi:MAG: hypothetical protein ACPHER_06910 [Nevskiales bacterium]